MTDTWTGFDLDTALADLADVLDRDAATAATSLAGVRARLVPAASPIGGAVPGAAGDGPDVLELGAPHGIRARPHRSRLVPALLLAAAVVAAAAVGVAVWPWSGPATPAASPAAPSVPSSAEPPSVATVEQWQARVAVPQARGANAVTLLSIVGVGSSTNISFPPLAAATDAAGRPLTLHYGWACGDPHVAPGSGDSVYALADTLDTGWSGACGSLAGGARVDTTDSVDAPTPLHRYSLQIAVANPDVVWRLVVWASTS